MDNLKVRLAADCAAPHSTPTDSRTLLEPAREDA